MKLYRVSLRYDTWAVFEIEAANKEAAIDSAYEQAPSGICHHCSRKVELGDIVDEVVEEAE